MMREKVTLEIKKISKKNVTAVTSVVHEDVLAVHLAVPWL